MAKMSKQHLFRVAFLILLVFNPSACVVLKHLMNPIKWIRENLIRKPLDKGAVVRAFVDPFPDQRVLTDAQFFKAADKYIPGPSVDTFTKQQVGTSFLTDKQGVQKANLAFLLSERMPDRVAFDQQKLAEYNATERTQYPKPDVVPEQDDGKTVDLNKILSPNFVTELKAASLENLLEPMIKESQKNRGEDGLTEGNAQLDQMLLERFGHLKEGQHVYDGGNLILNLPATSADVISSTTSNSKKTEPRVAYIDLSDLKPLLTNRVLTVFTGLGSYTVPLGYEEMIPNGTNYIPDTSEDTKPARVSSDAFGDKLKMAANQGDVYRPPNMLTLHPRPVETVETVAVDPSNKQILDNILNRFEKIAAMSANRATKESNDDSVAVDEPAVTEAFNKVDLDPARVASTPRRDLYQPLTPVYTATTAPQTINPYDGNLPQPVYGHPEVHETELSATPATDDDVKHHMFKEQVLGLQSVTNTTVENSTLTNKTEADIEKLQNAIVSRIHGGMEGYFQHVKDNHDDQNCISLMICEMSADPPSYGIFGNNTATYFRESTFPTEDLASNYYKRLALMAEEHRNVQRCRSSFKECLLSSLQLVELGRGLMFDIVLD